MGITTAFTVVNSNGAVQFSGHSENPAANLTAYGQVILSIAPDNTYWNGVAWSPLKDMSATNTASTGTWLANGTSTWTYGPNLPPTTTFRITCDNPRFISPTNRWQTVSDGHIALTTLTPGNYTIVIQADQFTSTTLNPVATY